jgi:hypothetical protein
MAQVNVSMDLKCIIAYSFLLIFVLTSFFLRNPLCMYAEPLVDMSILLERIVFAFLHCFAELYMKSFVSLTKFSTNEFLLISIFLLHVHIL